MIKIFFLTAFLSFPFLSKALVINKCILENGTTSYQKESCIEDKSTILENIQKRKSKNIQKKNELSEKEFQNFLNENLSEISIGLKNYNINVLKIKQWKVFKKILGDDLLHLKFIDDTSGSEISLLIDFLLPQNNKVFSQKELDEMMIKTGENYLSSSIQNEVNLVKIDVEDGIGVVANFTDKNLINKSSYPPGEYLNTLAGLIFKKGFYIHFTLLSNDINSVNHIVALTSMLGGIEISKLSRTNKPKSTNPLDVAFDDYYNGKKRESVAKFKEITLNKPKNPEAWFGYCLALRDTNSLQSAFVACDNAITYNPNDIRIYESTLNLYSISRVWQQGLEFIKNSIPNSQNRSLVNAIINFGYHAMLDGQFEIAKSAFILAQKRGANSEKLTTDFASVEFLMGNTELAQNKIKMLLKNNPSDEYALLVSEAIKQNNKAFFLNVNELPYMEIPNHLTTLGQGLNINQKSSNWVTKIFPVKGIGKIRLTVPETWFEHTQITASDKNTNQIAIKLLDLENFSVLTFTIGKVSKDWTIADLKKQMTSSLGVFFNNDEVSLKPLEHNRQGFKFSGITQKDKDATFQIIKQSELKGILSVSSTLVSYKQSPEINEIVKTINNSIKINDYNNTPLISNTKIPVNNSVPAISSKLPKAPQGFSWVNMPEIMSAFLKPEGWFVHNKKSKDGHTYAISKESIKKYGSFNTGLTVIGIQNVWNKFNLPPYAIALQMFEGIKLTKSNTVVKTKDTSQGPFKSFFVRYENNPEVAEAIIVHKIFIANDKTSSLYIVSFEAPKETWNQAWKLGNTILKHYLVDDEF